MSPCPSLLPAQVLPIDEGHTRVIMEYYVHPSKVRGWAGLINEKKAVKVVLSYTSQGSRQHHPVRAQVQRDDKEWISRVLAGADIVQVGDVSRDLTRCLF